jgi:antitoxin (DNA-binding transcriptional repressor) of toxin-antitoxin stability system
MVTVTVEEAQADLAGLVSRLKPGEELLITKQDKAKARLTAEPPEKRQPRKPGSAIGRLRIIEDRLW